MYGNIFDYNLFWPAEYDPGMTYYKQLDFLFKKVQELEARVAELESNSRTPDRTTTSVITTSGTPCDITTSGTPCDKTRTRDITDKWTCTD